MPHLWIELWLMRMIGSLAGSSELLDRVMYLLLRNDLLKGVPFAAALLGLWAVSELSHQEAERVSVLHIVLAAMAALIIGRIMQNVIDSARPLMVPDIAAMYPAAVQGYQFDWNSFPSDHMALYFAIALGTLWLRRTWGIVLLIWSLAGVAFPRLYVGYHYPLDILGGMAVATVSSAILWWARGWLSVPLCKIDHLATRYPAFGTAGMFCLCFQIATVFDSIRELGKFGCDGLRFVLTTLWQ
ncbi:MAG TPA: phosphatase PAP2 family protein [Candidatus Tectomicrobia bacterium]|nr:phosphatase PAP2 family protein [Candidatus Tectomicrobia bacterium]